MSLSHKAYSQFFCNVVWTPTSGFLVPKTHSKKLNIVILFFRLKTIVTLVNRSLLLIGYFGLYVRQIDAIILYYDTCLY